MPGSDLKMERSGTQPLALNMKVLSSQSEQIMSFCPTQHKRGFNMNNITLCACIEMNSHIMSSIGLFFLLLI